MWGNESEVDKSKILNIYILGDREKDNYCSKKNVGSLEGIFKYQGRSEEQEKIAAR